MTGWPRARGSIRRRLTLQLLTSAAILAVILFLIVSSFARQISAESQDRILSASVASILDAVSVASGEVSVDIPYSAFTMLDNPSDDRVFYRIMQDGEVITGYDDLPATTPRHRHPALSRRDLAHRHRDPASVRERRPGPDRRDRWPDP